MGSNSSIENDSPNNQHCQCPICMEMTGNNQTITTPCNHGMCRECFKSIANLETFNCPICREPLTSWIQTKKTERWKDFFITSKCESSQPYNLHQNMTDSTNRFGQKCAKPGEIRQEYLDLLKREEESIREEQEAEENQSIKFIRDLIVIKHFFIHHIKFT